MWHLGRSSDSSQSAQGRHFPIVFWGLLALAAAVRLIGITRPLLGNFATKNCVYAMIARNWAEGRAGLFYPTLDVLKGGFRSLHLLEFPVSAYLSGWLWKIMGGSLDVWGRATAVVFSVGSVALLFLFVRRRHGQSAAAAAALLLALSPVSIIYGQSFMLEASLVFFTLATFYTLDRWLAAGHLAWLLVAGVSLALLLLTKIYMLVVLLPLAVTVLRSQRIPQGRQRNNFPVPEGDSPIFPAGKSGRSPSCSSAAPKCPTRCMACCIVFLAILPAAFWYAFAYQTASPNGPYAQQIYYSLRQGAQAQRAAYRLLVSPDFYRQILDALTGVVLTPVGFMLLLAGLLDRQWRQHAAWLLAMVVLVLALPRKFHEMNYYYMAVLPPLCIVAGLGWQVIRQRVCPGRMAVAGLLLVAVLFSLRYAVGPAFVTPREDRGVLDAARQIRRLTTPNEPVVTVHGTTVDLLYYCRRPGWVLEPDDPQWEAVLEDCRRRGARYVVVVGKGPTVQFPVICGNNYRIHRLQR